MSYPRPGDGMSLPQPMTIPQLRRLLNDVLPSDSALEAFLLDGFPTVYRQLSSGMDRVAKVNLLLTYASPEEIVEHLRIQYPTVSRYASARDGRPDVDLPPILPPPARRETAADQPVPLAVLFDPYDRDLFQEMRMHLSLLERRGVIRTWTSDEVTAGGRYEETMQQALNRAEVILLLVSPSFMASDRSYDQMQQALERQRRGDALVIPVLLGPVPLQESPLAYLQPLPADLHPITTRRDRDEVWAEVVQGIRTAVQYRPKRVPAPDPGPPVKAPDKALPIGKIFALSGSPSATFVPPAQFSELVALLGIMGQGLVVEGPSGSGKTTAIRKALESFGARAEWVRCQEEPEKVDRLLKGELQGHVVLDDFHYLDEERRRRVARRIKSLADEDDSIAKITLSGVSMVRTSLIRDLPDLGSRLFSVAMSKQPPEKIADLITQGERAANIEFTRRAEFINAAGGSFFIAQHLCFRAATQAGVQATQTKLKVIDLGPKDVEGSLMEHLRSQFRESLGVLVLQDQVSPPRGAVAVLLWLLSRDLTGYVPIEEARYRFPHLSPAFDWLRGGQFGAFIRTHERLARMVHFDEQAGILSIEDPQFEYYLRNLRWGEFLAATGHRSLQFDRDGQLIYLPPPSPRPPEQQPPVVAPPAEPTAAVSVGRPVALGRLLPQSLCEALQARRVIPFAGAGVSMAVRDRQKSGQTDERLFPSWANLLHSAAERLEMEGIKSNAMIVRGMLEMKPPDYLQAARYARHGLGPRWYRYLADVLNPPRQSVLPESLELARALWQLGSKLIVTTNYDRVLRWACPSEMQGDLRLWDIQAPAALVEMLHSGVSRPTVWHLHGSIDNLSDLILTPDGYHRLYPERDEGGAEYQAALTSLRILLASRTFLFVGFSFADQSFGDQLRWASEVFKGAAGPHYMLVKADEQELVRERLRDLTLELIPFSAYGEPLLHLLQDMAVVAGTES